MNIVTEERKGGQHTDGQNTRGHRRKERTDKNGRETMDGRNGRKEGKRPKWIEGRNGNNALKARTEGMDGRKGREQMDGRKERK
jgi:hypothetical protein